MMPGLVGAHRTGRLRRSHEPASSHVTSTFAPIPPPAAGRGGSLPARRRDHRRDRGGDSRRYHEPGEGPGHIERRGRGARCQLVRVGPLLQHAGLQRSRPRSGHGRHRPEGVRDGLHPGRRRLHADLGRHRPGVVGHAGRLGHQRGAQRRRRRDRLRGRLRRHQARPGLRLGLGHRRRLPAGDHQVRAARDGLRPGGAGDRELVGDRQRARRRADPAAEQPRSVRVDHDAVHHRPAPTTSAGCCSTRPRAWASRRTTTRSCRSTAASTAPPRR